jgi:hypothetical protein
MYQTFPKDIRTSDRSEDAIDIHLHWTSIRSRSSWLRGRFGTSESIPSKLEPFPARARFLIGATYSMPFDPSLNSPPSNAVLGNRSARGHSNGSAASVRDFKSLMNNKLEDTFSSAPSNPVTKDGLTVNQQCTTSLFDIGARIPHRIRVLGTADASYIPDQLQAAISGGQYVTVGIQKCGSGDQQSPTKTSYSTSARNWRYLLRNYATYCSSILAWK